MAKKMTKKETEGAVFLIIISAVVVGIFKFFEVVGFVIPVVIIITAVALVWWYRAWQKQQRLAYLRGKYRDEGLVQKIFDGCCWEGQTAAQLMDSLGQPVEVDKKVLKTKNKETWKYGRVGSSRFKLKIMLENDTVVGWDKKA